MKILLFIMVFVWAECGNATDYFFNGEPVVFKADRLFHSRFSQEYDEKGQLVAIAMQENYIRATSHAGTFLPDDEGAAPSATVPGDASILMDGKVSRITHLSELNPRYAGDSFDFDQVIFGSVETLTLSALERCPSILRSITISRRGPGPIGIHGRLNFTSASECFQVIDGSLAESLEYPDIADRFLIAGAHTVEYFLDQNKLLAETGYTPAGGSPKKFRTPK